MVYALIVSLRVKPDTVDRFAAAELLEPGGQVNTFATPVFPADLPEAVR
jgi:hypothetical protein